MPQDKYPPVSKPIRLEVTEPNVTNTRLAQFNLKQVSSWLHQLPRSNPDACGPALVEMVAELNRTVLLRMRRFEVTELLRPFVYDTCELLIRRYKNSALPLPAKHRQSAALTGRLQEELGNSFKICVNQQLAFIATKRGESTARLQLSIQRALLALGRALLESFRLYAVAPVRLWEDAHRLYRNAEIMRLQSLPIEGAQDAEETALSIKQAYLRIAILALCNPHHLMQGEAAELYRRIGRWAHFVQVELLATDKTLEGRFFVDLDSDFPPRYVPRGLKLPAPGAPRVLSVDKLVQVIDQQLERLQATLASARSGSTLSDRMQRDMYVRFRAALGGRQERADTRQPSVAGLILVSGLSAAHFILNARQPFVPEAEERQWHTKIYGKENNSPLELKLADPEEYAPRTAAGPGGDTRVSRFRSFDREVDDIWKKANLVEGNTQASDAKQSVSFRTTPWNRKNESPGGMALFCASDLNINTRVGELVAFSESDTPDPAKWRLGAVRWLRARADAGLEIGVQFIADSAYAAGTKAMQGIGAGSEYLRALIIPRVNPLSGNASLITPAAVYDVGTVVALNLSKLVVYVKLTELVETTRLYAHFRFRAVPAPADSTPN